MRQHPHRHQVAWPCASRWALGAELGNADLATIIILRNNSCASKMDLPCQSQICTEWFIATTARANVVNAQSSSELNSMMVVTIPVCAFGAGTGFDFGLGAVTCALTGTAAGATGFLGVVALA